MMAKMFYTLEEAKSALNKSEEEIKSFAREGRLREFRDGPRLMFKADQVEQLKAELTGTDQVDLGTSDSGGLIGLVDTTGASGTSITLADTDAGQASGAGMRTKEDTALATDLGLSGTAGGIPSPGRAQSGTGLSGSAQGSRSGINVFGSETGVDPSAQTAITGGVREQLNLESVGSGSGLLDLSREADDTSLGAVLGEIGPGGTRAGTAAGVEISESGLDLEEPVGGVTRASGPMMVEAADPMSPAFGWAALGGAIVLLYGIYVLLAGTVGIGSEAAGVKQLVGYGWWAAAAGGAVVIIVLFIIGLLIGKSTSGQAA